MIYLVLTALFLVWLVARLRTSRIAVKVLDSQYRLYEVRDALRELSLHGNVDCKTWIFGYLDSSIVRTIDLLPKLSLWQALFLWFRYRNNPTVTAAALNLREALERPENQELRQIYRLYLGVVILFLVDRHSLLAAATYHASHMMRACASFFERVGRMQTEAPGTSTLLDFSQV
jgi:hypothetical protein